MIELNILTESSNKDTKTYLTEAEAIEEAFEKNRIVAYYEK